MNYQEHYQENVEKVVQELYDTTRAYAPSRTYTISYNYVSVKFGLNLGDKKTQNDVWEMSYSAKFCDLIQTLDFDDDNGEVTVMIWESNKKKKYNIGNYEEFCRNALVVPPIEQFEDGNIDEKEWYKENMIHITVGNHDIELDYHADNVNEIEYALREMYEVEQDIKYATTGNTKGSEYPNATWKDILRFAVVRDYYERSFSIKDSIQKYIYGLTAEKLAEVMGRIGEQSSMNDDLGVNFSKLETKDLHKILSKEERRKAFKEILCSKIEISELIDQDGKHDDIVVIMDYSIKPSGDLVGWHYGVDFDKNSEVNQEYIQKYIEEMIG